jgi:hypothetical protein
MDGTSRDQDPLSFSKLQKFDNIALRKHVSASKDRLLNFSTFYDFLNDEPLGWHLALFILGPRMDAYPIDVFL